MTTAVRTTDAKLIKYPGHDEWTEVFDLKADPYEVKNLAADPAYAGLRQRLEAEYVKQAKAIEFMIPEFADKPSAAGDSAGKKKSGKKKAK
jgi:arylsulfatase A-like enzyme